MEKKAQNSHSENESSAAGGRGEQLFIQPAVPRAASRWRHRAMSLLFAQAFFFFIIEPIVKYKKVKEKTKPIIPLPWNDHPYFFLVFVNVHSWDDAVCAVYPNFTSQAHPNTLQNSVTFYFNGCLMPHRMTVHTYSFMLSFWGYFVSL